MTPERAMLYARTLIQEGKKVGFMFGHARTMMVTYNQIPLHKVMAL